MGVRRRVRRPQFSVGSVLGPSFGIWFRNFIPFTFMMALVQLPVIVLSHFNIAGWQETGDPVAFLRSQLLVGALGFALTLVATGALVYGVLEQMSGKPASIGQCLTVGVSRLFPVLGVGILFVLIIGAFVLLAGVLFAVTESLVGAIPAGIGAAYYATMYWVAVPAAVVERPGVLGALRRSRELTMGVKGTIFLILLLLRAIEWAIGKILETALLEQLEPATYIWVTVAFSIVWGGLTATTSAVGYSKLRVSKEGANIDELRKVFA